MSCCKTDKINLNSFIKSNIDSTLLHVWIEVQLFLYLNSMMYGNIVRFIFFIIILFLNINDSAAQSFQKQNGLYAGYGLGILHDEGIPEELSASHSFSFGFNVNLKKENWMHDFRLGFSRKGSYNSIEKHTIKLRYLAFQYLTGLYFENIRTSALPGIYAAVLPWNKHKAHGTGTSDYLFNRMDLGVTFMIMNQSLRTRKNTWPIYIQCQYGLRTVTDNEIGYTALTERSSQWTRNLTIQLGAVFYFSSHSPLNSYPFPES